MWSQKLRRNRTPSWRIRGQRMPRKLLPPRAPDLVIAAVPFQEKAVAEILKSGVRFLGLAPKTLADIYTDIATIAGLVCSSERGEEVILQIKQRIEQVRARATGL